MLLEGDNESVDFCPHFYFSGSLIENVDSFGLYVLILLIEGDELGRWLWLEALQPVEEIHKHFRGSQLAALHSAPHRVNPAVTGRRHGVVEDELAAVFERLWDHMPGEDERRGIRNMGKHEGNVID